MNAATLPAGFKYTAAFLAGRPIHKDDHFAYRHPRMDRGKRAKIFAPFDALDGYSESIAAKNVQYVERIQLEEYEKNRLDNQFRILQTLTRNGKVARANKIVVSVTYYIPCMDEDGEICDRDWHLLEGGSGHHPNNESRGDRDSAG